MASCAAPGGGAGVDDESLPPDNVLIEGGEGGGLWFSVGEDAAGREEVCG